MRNDQRLKGIHDFKRFIQLDGADFNDLVHKLTGCVVIGVIPFKVKNNVIQNIFSMYMKK